MRSERIRLLVEVALTVALCAALKLWRIHMPFGGDVSLEMLPILVLAMRRGVGPAMLAGAIWGLVDFIYEPFYVAPIQFLLDYPVAFAMLGLAGFGSRQWRRLYNSDRIVLAEVVAVPWMVLGAAGRFASHFVSGVIFFASDAPKGQPVWIYSALYNLSYIVPSLIMCVIAALVLLPVLEAAVPVSPRTMGPVVP